MHVHVRVDVYECECVCAPFRWVKRKSGTQENLDWLYFIYCITRSGEINREKPRKIQNRSAAYEFMDDVILPCRGSSSSHAFALDRGELSLAMTYTEGLRRIH